MDLILLKILLSKPKLSTSFESVMNWLNLSLDDFCLLNKMTNNFFFTKMLKNLFRSHFVGNPSASLGKNETLRFLGVPKVKKLMKNIFLQLAQYIEKYGSLKIGKDKNWINLINKLLFALAVIMEDCELFDSVILQRDNNEPAIVLRNHIDSLVQLSRHPHKCACQAIYDLRQMIFGGDESRIEKFEVLFSKDPTLIKFVAESNIRRILRGSDLAKSRSLALIYLLLHNRIPEVRQLFSTICDCLPKMIERVFQPQCNEAVLHKMSLLLYEMSTFKRSEELRLFCVSHHFLDLFTKNKGFAALTAMLSHESEKVLFVCLQFLDVNCNKPSIRGIVDFRETAIALMRLICTSKDGIAVLSLRIFWRMMEGKAGLQAITILLSYDSEKVLELCLDVLDINCDKIREFVDFRETVIALMKLLYKSKGRILRKSLMALWKILKKNAKLKEIVTTMRGPELIFQILSQPLTEPSLRYSLLLLTRLLTTVNPLCHAAAHQILDLPQSKTLFVALMGIKEHTIDINKNNLLVILQELNSLAPGRMKDLMFWRSNSNCLMADAVVHLIFSGFIDYQLNEDREQVVTVRNHLTQMVLNRCSTDFDYAVLFARYLGNSSEKENPINLFSLMFDPTNRAALLKFLYNLANSDFPCLRSLPKIWAQHSQFEQIMASFAQSKDKEEVRQSHYLMLLAKSDR